MCRELLPNTKFLAAKPHFEKSRFEATKIDPKYAEAGPIKKS